MAKPLKIATIIFGIVIAAIVVIAIALTILVDPNRYRDDIIRAVKTQTGRELKIDGKLSLSLFPWIGLATKRLELSNATGFGSQPFAVVDSTETKVELLPLLRKKIVVNAVRLNGLKLNLARNAKGRTNWDDLTAPANGKPAPKAAPNESGGAGAALAAFTINRFEVRNSEFTWRDDAANAQYAVRGLDLTSGNLLGSAPAPLKLAFNLESKSPPIRERVQLDARLRFDAATEALDVPDLKLSLGDLRVQARLSGGKMLSAPKLAGSVEIPAFDARALLQRLGIDYKPTEANALRKVALSTKFSHDATASALSDLRVTLDETQITGKFTQKHQSAPSYSFDVGIDAIDVDRYLPPPTKEPTKKEGPKPQAAAVIPVALLRNTEADGRLRIQKLKAFGIRSEQITIMVAAHGGKIVLGPNQAKLYGGSYAGRTVIDASTATPRFQFEEKLAGVQIGPFLKDADVFDRYSGTGNVDLKLSAQGFDAAQIKRTLNGTAAIDFRDGTIQGVNLQKMMQQARAAYDQVRGKEVRAKPDAGDETAFRSLTATVRVTDGLARNDDLKLDGPVVRASGGGTANLAQETIDYRLQVTVAEAAGRAGATLPLRIGGTFAAPEYRVDFSALLKEKATKPLEQKLEQKKGEAADKLRNRLLDKLRR